MKKKESAAHYLIFARKFRPETFEEIVGQEGTTQILQNAIRTGRIPQAFLFAGPRGTGKTSTARVLAKALNCEKGPTESPCGECGICLEIARSASLDVLEIDGASNRRIDEIRDLRENVKFKPAQARFKIYIIDEVHMLTDEAFNALLKTLEEPPPHVKFIFATTEPHKVPLTILSRCQRFNFKRIPTESIVETLKQIAKQEGLKAPAAALFAIARAADGSLRDAEMLLDQLSSLSEGEIKEDQVLFALGLAGDEIYFELLEALRKKEARGILSLVKSLYESGKDLVQFGRGLAGLFRNLLLLEMGGGSEAFVEMGPESKKKLAGFKTTFSREELILILSLLQHLQADLRRAVAPPRLLIETALLKLLHIEGLRRVEDLMEQAEETTRGKTPPAPPHSGPRHLPASVSPPSSFAVPSGGRKDEPGPAAGASFSLNDIERIWPQILEAVKAQEMSTGMFLAEAEPMEAVEGAVVVGFPEEFQFHKEMLERPEKRRMVEDALAQFLGSPARVQFVATRVFKTEASREGTPEKKPAPLPDIVQKAMDIFQGSKVVRSE